MRGMDYQDDAEPLFQSLPKNDEFLAKLSVVKESLKAVADRVTAEESKRLHECIQDPYRALT